MKVTQEQLPHSQMGLEIEIDAARGQQAFETTVRKYLKTARVPGFRPGKAPRPIVMQYLGKQAIKAEALEKLLDQVFKEALEQEQVNALGNYQVLSKFDELLAQFEPGQTLTFRASVDVQPTVELRSDYNAMTVAFAPRTFDPAQVEETIEAARARKATFTPAGARPAQLGDVAVLDFLGRTLDGAEIDGAKGTDFEVELEVDRFIPGFIDGIIGMQPLETREVSATFPENYAKAELSGQAAVFTITLKELKDKVVPDLTDELAQELGEVETLEAWRAKVEAELKAQVEQSNQESQEAALLSALLEGTTIELPKTLIEQEFQHLAEQYLQNLTRQGINPDILFKEENMPFLREQISQEAILRLRRTLSLAEVARREQLTVSDEQLTPRMAEYVRDLKEQVDRETLITLVRDELLTENILTWLKEHATIEEPTPEAPLAALGTEEPEEPLKENPE